MQLHQVKQSIVSGKVTHEHKQNWFWRKFEVDDRTRHIRRFKLGGWRANSWDNKPARCGGCLPLRLLRTRRIRFISHP